MYRLWTVTFIIAFLTVICGCQQTLTEVFVDASEIDKQLVNYALPENGGVIFVSQDNPDYPASTLTNGIVSSENWDKGEGWAAHFDGEYEYGGYMEVGEREQLAALNMGGSNTRQRANPNRTAYSRDLYGGELAGSTASEIGWVIIQLAAESLVTRVIVHTIDSEKYPANQYGVSDFAVQYWTPHAHGWKSVDRIGKKIGEQHNSIRNNKQGRVTVRFKPVRTSRIRLLIRLTNDTETYDKRRSVGYVRGMLSRVNLRSMRGTIRLTEIEIYGLEKKDENASAPPSQDMANDQLLDDIFAEESETAELASEEFPLTETPIEIRPREQIEAVIRRYASAYTNQDLPALMATISPNYSREGENYTQLREKMVDVFRRYMQIDLSLQKLRIQGGTGTATVDADYVIALTSAGRPPSTFSGRLFFELTASQGGWQISGIDTQGR